MARYEHAFYAPLLSDWRNFETWRDDGAIDATRRANRIWKELLAAYEPPPMDPAVAEEIAAFVARRKEEGGVPDQ
jgi:trimethylamine---corrinoid protein Co-methyltransferase